MYRELEASVAAAGAATLQAGPNAAATDLTIEEVRIDSLRDAAPYRELTFALRRLKMGSRDVPEASVRLVEHHGHPGLVIFGADRGMNMLESWCESGREEGLAYALLVPSDAHCQPIFDAMGSTDWRLTQALLVRLEGQLRQLSAPAEPIWQQLARRMREQLLEMPARFRYDSLAIEAVGEAGAGELTLRFGQVHCGARQLDRLTLHWRPSGPLAALELLCDAQAGPPLPSWPAGADGEIPDRLRLPLGNALSDEAKRQHWSRLPLADREFVQALILAWPDLARRHAASLLDAGVDPATVSAAAIELAKDLLRTQASLRAPTPSARPGALLRRVARRLSTRTASAT